MNNAPMFGNPVPKASTETEAHLRHAEAAKGATLTGSLSRHSNKPLFGGQPSVKANRRDAGGGAGLIGRGLSFGVLGDSETREDVAKAADGPKLHPIAARHPELPDLARRMLSLFAAKADSLPPGTAIDVTGMTLANHFGVPHEAASAALGILVANGMLDRRHGGSLGEFLGYVLGRGA